jgi:hypothetical protein
MPKIGGLLIHLHAMRWCATVFALRLRNCVLHRQHVVAIDASRTLFPLLQAPCDVQAIRSGSSSSCQSDGWGTPDEHSNSSDDDDHNLEQALSLTENDFDEVLAATDLTVMDDSTSRSSSSSGGKQPSSCAAGKATASIGMCLYRVPLSGSLYLLLPHLGAHVAGTNVCHCLRRPLACNCFSRASLLV